jgi:hypothetical protein
VPEFFNTVGGDASVVRVEHVLLRLALALVFGTIVAWIYRRTTPDRGQFGSFPVTLALLAVLIAMVTQVIGDSVARAFSMVGALSIVRFRTVVRDTKDTAFVVFAVVVGMAAGAQSLWIAVIGIAVVGVAAFVTAARAASVDYNPTAFLVTVRVGLGYEADEILGGTLDKHLYQREVVSVHTAKQGAALNITYHGRMRRSASAEQLVKNLNLIEGVQDVKFERSDLEG